MCQIKDSDLNPTMVASQTFDSIIKQILTSNLNFQLQVSPFSANISLKKTPIKDKSGVPICLPASHPPVKTEADESLHQKQPSLTNFPFPPPGFSICQPCTEVKVPPHDDLKYTDLCLDFSELKLKFENIEHSKIALEEEVESKSKLAKNIENKNVELEKDLLAFKMENGMLKENSKDLESDIRKLKKDYFELTKKVASQHNEYQEKIKELGFERTVVEERNIKKEAKKAKKKSKRELKVKDSENISEVEELRCGDYEPNNGIEFNCTLCAKLCDIAELSSKSVPEEHDACKDCNVEDTGLAVSSTGIINQAFNEPEKVKDVAVNAVQYFWNGDLYQNNRLAIDYINMCNYSNHDCAKCSYISVMNEGVAPGRTGGWSMQFCEKFNFKLGDPYKDPPYMLGSLPS
jgi:hypothetical protein